MLLNSALLIKNTESATTERIVEQIRERASNLFLTRQFLCAEAVMVSLNRRLGGGLKESQAVTLAAPFCSSLGDSGCICGALSGAVMATGLFLGNRRTPRRRKQMRESARLLHDEFKVSNGATCCRVLSREVRHDRKARFYRCAELTAQAAEMAARLIIRERPELLLREEDTISLKKESKLKGTFLVIRRFLLE